MVAIIAMALIIITMVARYEVGDGIGNQYTSSSDIPLFHFEMEPTFGEVLFSDGQRGKSRCGARKFHDKFSLEG